MDFTIIALIIGIVLVLKFVKSLIKFGITAALLAFIGYYAYAHGYLEGLL